MSERSYLALGHVTVDRIGRVDRVGGTVAYAGFAAQSLGWRVRIVSSGKVVPGILRPLDVHWIPSRQSTTFVYEESRSNSAPRVVDLASNLSGRSIPAEWLGSDLWHLGPVCGELAPTIVDAIPAGAFVGLTAQGWLRQLGPSGEVRSTAANLTEAVLDRISAIVLSNEDLKNSSAVAEEWSQAGPVVVLTKGDQGACVFAGCQRCEIPPSPATALDSTGAGDVFATGFFTALWDGMPPEHAARFASALASVSTEKLGPQSPPTREEAMARIVNEVSEPA